MYNRMIDRVIQIVNICIPKINFDSSNLNDNLEDYGFDSMTMIKVIIVLEEEFNIEIPNQFHLIEEINTIGKMIAILNLLREDQN